MKVKIPMKVSVSVRINELIPRIPKVEVGAYLMLPNYPNPLSNPEAAGKNAQRE